MSARERVLASRLAQKIDNNERYARQIGLSYTMTTFGTDKSNNKSVKQKNTNK